MQDNYTDIPSAVFAPARARGLKLWRSSLASSLHGVRARAGAWIETRSRWRRSTPCSFAPARARGLKRRGLRPDGVGIGFAPARARRLKQLGEWSISAR